MLGVLVNCSLGHAAPTTVCTEICVWFTGIEASCCCCVGTTLEASNHVVAAALKTRVVVTASCFLHLKAVLISFYILAHNYLLMSS